MIVDWKILASKSSQASRIVNINSYLGNSASNFPAPIDVFYEHRLKVITTATPEFIAATPWLSGYIMVSLISATELYFREVFSRIIEMCPVSSKASSGQSIHIGSVLWHGTDLFTKAAFEHMSFADTDKIKKCSREFLKFNIRDNTQTAKALEPFETLCELRHGVVHSGLILPGKNAANVGALKTGDRIMVDPKVAQIHEAAAICTALVESYNLELYEEIVTRWATTWRAQPNWSIDDEFIKLKKLAQIFYSTLSVPVERPSMAKIKNIIKRDLNI
jgi:hypothetical protein